MWWNYAYLSVKQRYRIVHKWKLSEVAKIADIRRSYIEVYISCLKEGNVGGNHTTRKLEVDLNEQTIFTFRKLAHLKVEDAKRTSIAAQTAQKSSTWSSWFWGTATVEKPSETSDRPFTQEDWRTLMETVDFQKEENVVDTPYTLQQEFAFHVKSCSLRLQDDLNQTFLHGTLLNTNACYKQYPKTMSYGFEIAQATLMSDGQPIMTTLHETVDQEMNSAVQFEYVILPQDRNVVASVKMETSSTYVLFHAQSMKTLMEFLTPKRSVDVSVLEAKAFSKFKEARNLAEKQVMDFNEPYDIQITLNAPKLAVPCTLEQQTKGLSLFLNN